MKNRTNITREIHLNLSVVKHGPPFPREDFCRLSLGTVKKDVDCSEYFRFHLCTFREQDRGSPPICVGERGHEASFLFNSTTV